MSLASIAALFYGAKPFFLYQFYRANEKFQYSNTAAIIDRVAEDTTWAGVPITWSADPAVWFSPLWDPLVISHGKIPDSDQAFRSEFKIEVPLDSVLTDSVTGVIDFIPVIVTIFKGDQNDAEIIPVFKGRIINAQPNENGMCTLTCMTEIAALQRKGLSAVIQRPCRHALYGKNCGVKIEDFRTDATVTAVSTDGLTLTVSGSSASANGYFSLGVIDWNNRLEMIISHTGGTLSLASPIPGLFEAVALADEGVSIAPGCGLSRRICNDVFSNINNFGGFPYISDNPFDGRQVF
jgi:uncharacterized phage protein (TIGR02218 family)